MRLAESEHRKWTLGSVVLAVGLVTGLLWLSAAAPAGAQTPTCAETPAVEVSASLPPAYIGESYSGQILLANVQPPITYSVVSGSLPLGLAMDSSTGAITGVPLVSGDSTFRVQVVDSSDPPACKTSNDLTISVGVDTSQVQSLQQIIQSLPGYLQRATPACILATIGAALGQGPPGACF
jgi:hypothetical protein